MKHFIFERKCVKINVNKQLKRSCKCCVMLTFDLNWNDVATNELNSIKGE